MASKTLDLRVKFTDHVGTETLISQYGDADNYWVLEHVHGTGLQYRVVSGASTIVTLAGGEVADTNWHHCALIKVDDEYGLYLDGVQTAYLSDADTDTFAGVLRIGALNASNYLDGYVDEIHITDDNYFGAAPNVGLTDTITVPTGPYGEDSNSYTLPCDSSSISIVGQDVAFKDGVSLSCETGAVTISGASTTFLLGQVFSCEAGIITLAGNEVVFAYDGNHILACEPAAVALSGQDVSFKLGISLICETQAISLTAIDAGLLSGKIYSCDGVDITPSGGEISFSLDYVLPCESAAIIIANNPDFRFIMFYLECEPANIPLQAIPTLFARDIVFSPEASGLNITGGSAELDWSGHVALISASMPMFTGEMLAESEPYIESIEATMPMFTGEMFTGASMSASMPMFTGSMEVDVPIAATLSASMPMFTGDMFTGAHLSASMPMFTGSMELEAQVLCDIAQSMPMFTGSVSVLSQAATTLAASMPMFTGGMNVSVPSSCAVVSTMPMFSGEIEATNNPEATISATMPMFSGDIAAGGGEFELAATMPMFTGWMGCINQPDEAVLRHIRGELR
jgi:hypothetical protein